MRKIIIIFSCCIVALLLGYVSYRGYEVWKQNHWMALAKQFAAKSDARNELLSLQQVLKANPQNIEACRMTADLAEAEHSPSALMWRQKVLELDPSSVTDRLALVQTALAVHDYATATNTLAGLNDAGRKSAAYFNVAGAVALTQNRLDEAQADFSESARLEPNNPVSMLNLGSLELHRTNSLDVGEGRITLKRLSMSCTNTVVRNQANRELVGDALRYKDFENALAFSQELLKGTNTWFGDKLLRLEVLYASKQGNYDSYLATLEREAAENPDKLSRLAMWLMEHRQTAPALSWMQTLPGNIRTNPPAAVLATQCHLLQQDWAGVQNFISKQNWGVLEFTRHAYLARALRQQGLYGASRAEWDLAFKGANGQKDPLAALFNFAVQWNWPDESQQVLWAIVNAFPKEQWASEYLEHVLLSTGSTRPLMQLFGTQVSRNPSDFDAKNNLALTAMLLHAQELNPYNLAKEVYQKSPTNLSYASTYAFSLYQQGKNTDALKVLQQFAPKQLEKPSVAGYYALILKANGNNAEASRYFKIASKANVLPEERAMFERAMQGI